MKATVYANINLEQQYAWVHFETYPSLHVERIVNTQIGFFEDFQASESGIRTFGNYKGPMDLAKRMKSKLEQLGYTVRLRVNMNWNFINEQKDTVHTFVLNR